MDRIEEFEAFREDLPDITSMDQDELLVCLQRLKIRIAALDEKEPADMMSEEYDAWGEVHEVLEDLLDEVKERLDDLL